MLKKVLKRTFWKTYVVDIVMLFLLAILGVFTKEFVGNFFMIVEAYQAEIAEIEPELIEQSITALASMEGMVADMNFVVWFAAVFMLVIVPTLVYLLFSLSQSMNVAFVKGKVKLKFILKSVAIGLPFLIGFIILLSQIGDQLTMILGSWISLWWLGLYFTIFVLCCYVWYTLICSRNWKVMYKKVYILLPFFLLFFVSFIGAIAFVAWVALMYATESLTSTNWIWSAVLALVFLSVVQVLRIVYVKAVAKCS